MKRSTLLAGLSTVVLIIGCSFAGCVDETGTEMKLWGTTTQLDLPVNVSRTIEMDVTTFTFTPQTDENLVKIETWAPAGKGGYYRLPIKVYENPISPISIPCQTKFEESGFVKQAWGQNPEMTILRENGTVESYTLRCRDGFRWG